MASRTQGTKADTYTWDTLNHLVRVTHPESNGTLKSYRYDYDCRVRRVLRQEGAETTLLMFSGGTSVAELGLATSDFARWQSGVYNHQAQAMQPAPATFTLAKSFVRGSDMGGGVGGLLYSEKQTATAKPGFTVSGGSLGGTWNGGTAYTASASFNHYNGRGDVVAKTDATGAITWTGAYEAYGKRTKETGVNDDRQRANTKDEDPTGLLNEGMRYRDLETGTWLSRDPAGFVDGPNLYAYVQQNPWSKFDPLGLSAWSAAIKAIKTGGNIAGAFAGASAHLSKAAGAMSFGEAFGHTWAALSEVLPVSVSDIEDGYDAAKTAIDAGKAAADGDYSKAAEIAKNKAVQKVEKEVLKKLTGSKKGGGNSSAGDAPKPGGDSAKKIAANQETGKRREAKTHAELQEENPDKFVGKERLLRDKDGNKLVDQETGEGRRVDHSVFDEKTKTAKNYETTGQNVDKTGQLAKEERIYEDNDGEAYVRHPETKEMYKTEGPSEVRRQD